MCSLPFLTLNVSKFGRFEEQLQLALSTVRTLRNTTVAAINRFPQEVLALIPTHLDPKTPRNTLNASHVCRYWRTAFVSFPTIWTAIDSTCMTPPLMQLYLDRSRMLPLDITLGTKTRAHVLQQFVDRAPQIRLLSFEMMPRSRWMALSERFSISALPALLGLWISVNTQAESGAPAPDPALFPHAFNLRHLSIDIFGPTGPIWSHIAFPSLTSIHIDFRGGYLRREFPAAPAPPIAMLDWLLDVFLSSPLLEDVHLAFRTLVTGREDTHRPVTLPRLQKFYISCSPTPVPLLMSITFPPTARILARTNVENLPIRDEMLSLGQHLSPLVSGSNELSFYVSETSALFTLHFKRDGETRVDFQYYGTYYCILLGQVLAFVTACPLDAVRRFGIGGRRVEREVTNDQVSGVMRNLINVETLTLKNSTHLLHLLLPVIQDGPPPCPRLKTLRMDGDQEVPHQEFVQVARARAEAGFPLQRVVLGTESFKKVASELRQFVEDVGVWEDL